MTMTSFGRWLGERNGEVMLFEVLGEYGCTQEQARAAVTTYCLIFGIQVDTDEWDSLMDKCYTNCNCWFDSLEEFDQFMCGLLI